MRMRLLAHGCAGALPRSGNRIATIAEIVEIQIIDKRLGPSPEHFEFGPNSFDSLLYFPNMAN